MKGVKIGVIPAAGKGTRMGYLSHILPKCMFPLYDKPIIHANVEKMVSLGVEQINIIVHYQKDKIIEYFKSVGDSIGAEINFIEQETLRGIADAIMLTRDFIDAPFMVMLGDDCTISKSLQNLADTFNETYAVALEAVVQEKNDDILKSTCCLKINKNKQITEIIEKPKVPISNLRGCGVYFFQDSIFDYIKRTPVSAVRNEVEITDVIKSVARERCAFGEFIDGLNININSYLELWKASTLVWEMKTQDAVSDIFIHSKVSDILLTNR